MPSTLETKASPTYEGEENEPANGSISLWDTRCPLNLDDGGVLLEL
mgnify:CR=1